MQIYKESRKDRSGSSFFWFIPHMCSIARAGLAKPIAKSFFLITHMGAGTQAAGVSVVD